MASLDEALASEVLVAAPDSRTAFAFGHELLRAALYDAIPPASDGACTCGRARRSSSAATPATRSRPPSSRTTSTPRCPRPICARPSTTADQASIAAALAHANEDVVRYAGHALEALDLMESPSPRLRMRLLLRQALHARLYSARESERYDRAACCALAREQRRGAPLASAALLLGVNPGFPPHARVREPRSKRRCRICPTPTTRRPRGACSRGSACDRAARLLRRAQRRAAGARELEIALRLGPPPSTCRCSRAQLYLTGGRRRGRRARRRCRTSSSAARRQPVALSVPPVLLDLHRAIVALQQGDFAAMRSGARPRRGALPRDRQPRAAVLRGALPGARADQRRRRGGAGGAARAAPAAAERTDFLGNELFSRVRPRWWSSASAEHSRARDSPAPRRSHCDAGEPAEPVVAQGARARGGRAARRCARRAAAVAAAARSPICRATATTSARSATSRAPRSRRTSDHVEPLYALLAPLSRATSPLHLVVSVRGRGGAAARHAVSRSRPRHERDRAVRVGAANERARRPSAARGRVTATALTSAARCGRGWSCRTRARARTGPRSGGAGRPARHAPARGRGGPGHRAATAALTARAVTTQGRPKAARSVHDWEPARDCMQDARDFRGFLATLGRAFRPARFGVAGTR